MLFEVHEGDGDRSDEHLHATGIHLALDAAPTIDNESAPVGSVGGETG